MTMKIDSLRWNLKMEIENCYCWMTRMMMVIVSYYYWTTKNWTATVMRMMN